MHPLTAPRSTSALPLLFAHYVAGKMAQGQWDAFAATFDEAEGSAEERAAFARFCLDASLSGEDVDLPKPDEWADILAATQPEAAKPRRTARRLRFRARW
jgi:hypothetical protein